MLVLHPSNHVSMDTLMHYSVIFKANKVQHVKVAVLVLQLRYLVYEHLQVLPSWFGLEGVGETQTLKIFTTRGT